MSLWDYLIVTASNARQAEAYERQLKPHSSARQALVVTDIDGKRIGSGGSTIECLFRIADLDRSRVLVIHAGGDSKRLPAYGPAGKIFVPLPGGGTLFDRIAATFLKLEVEPGQVVVTSGDALIEFDAASLDLRGSGVVMTGCPVSPTEASRHGVLCAGDGGSLRLYLQKPPADVQASAGAIGPDGRAILDIGVMAFDAKSARVLIETFAPFREVVLSKGVDLYREICCAMGTDATVEHYIEAARASGSTWDPALLSKLYPALHRIPASVRVVPECRFLHFGSTRQLIDSGMALTNGDKLLSMNNVISPGGSIEGEEVWVEGCRISAPLKLGGRNAVIGVDVNEPLSLPRGACLEVLAGHSRSGEPVHFVRCYGIDDTFKDAQWMERPLHDGVDLWGARVFPAERDPTAYRKWLWLFDNNSTLEEAGLYSAAEIALLADQDVFHRRRYAKI